MTLKGNVYKLRDAMGGGRVISAIMIFAEILEAIPWKRDVLGEKRNIKGKVLLLVHASTVLRFKLRTLLKQVYRKDRFYLITDVRFLSTNRKAA